MGLFIPFWYRLACFCSKIHWFWRNWLWSTWI